MGYAEAHLADSMVVALDQEKAYDKIWHDYLWAMLKKLDLPPSLISTICSLYQHAQTLVMVNKQLSLPYFVMCGV